MNTYEADYIKQHLGTKSAKEIALDLGKSVRTIYNYIQRSKIIEPNKPEADLLTALQTRPEWKQFKREFSRSELDYFNYRYVKLIAQFKEDILGSEEAQLFLLIKFELLMNRNLVERKKLEDEAERIESFLLKLDRSGLDKQTLAQIVALEGQLAGLRIAKANYTKEFISLETKHASLLKELRATREQRIKVVEGNKKSFLDIIRMLHDESIRAEQAKQIALVNLATEKELQRLSDSHVFQDGVIDQPILTAQTVKD